MASAPRRWLSCVAAIVGLAACHESNSEHVCRTDAGVDAVAVTPCAQLGFQAPVTYDVSGPTPGGPSASIGSVVIADMNGDGAPDLVVYNEAIAGVEVWLNTGGGVFATPAVQAAGSAYDEYCMSGIATTDLDLDGHQDVVITTVMCYPVLSPFYGNEGILEMLGNGDGTFAPPRWSSAGANPTQIKFGDFNRDGFVDAVVWDTGDLIANGPNYTPSYTKMLFGGGKGYLNDVYNVSTGLETVVGDFDQDCILDLAGPGGVWLGDGSGYFVQHQATLGEMSSSASGDFNNDGKLDLVGGVGDDVGVFLNRSDGTLEPAVLTNVTNGGSIPQIVVADFDGDGLTDVALVSSLSVAPNDFATVAVMLGHGDGSFAPPMTIPLQTSANSGLTSLAVADLDGDGRPDLVVTVANYPTVETATMEMDVLFARCQ